MGVSDRILLSCRYPLYLETGLYLSNKGVKPDIAYEDVPGTSQIRPRVALMYLQLPVMIAYHFRLGRATALQPFVGGYHSVGISCKQKEGYSGRITGTATTDSAKRKTTRPPGFRENARRNTKNPLRNGFLRSRGGGIERRLPPQSICKLPCVRLSAYSSSTR